MICKELKQYVEKYIFPENNKNEAGHNMEHVNYVINRSLKFAKQVSGININMVYTVAAYHDIAHHIDYKNHEIESAKILYNDENLRKFFSEEEMLIMKEAIEDHRASLDSEPRNIYGKIVSSADRGTSISQSMRRTYYYRIEHSIGKDINEIIEDSRLHLLKKFGKGGYANKKIYFKDEEYEKYLEDITRVCNDKELFYKKYIETNNLDINYEDLIEQKNN